MNSNEILKIYGTEFTKMTIELLEASCLIDMIPGRDTMVGIKPNLVAPTPAEFGATTHPEIVAGIIEYLQNKGHNKIMILEGSWVGDKTKDAYEYCGYRSISEKYKVPFVDTQLDGYYEKDCDGMTLNICNSVEKVDFLINVPVVKGHCITKITCALKNLKGLIPNTEKRKFHTIGLHKPIAHLNKGIHQDFIVADHICGDMDFEEGGNPVVKNCIMAAVDPVLLDSYACGIVGCEIEEVPYITMSEELGVGTTDLSKAIITELNKSDINDDKPREKKLLKVAYAINEVFSCSACYGNLVPALYRLEEEGLLEKIDTQISIGQGHQGKKGKLGVGKCTKDHDFCIMGCPPNEDKIYEELKKYILG